MAFEWLSKAERWRCGNPAPLTLRAWLRSPLAWDPYQGIKCEGALQYAVVLMASGRTPDDAFADAPPNELVPIPIPIADTKMAGFPIAYASWAQSAPGSTETVRIRRKRAEAESLAMGKVNVSMDKYKSEQIPVPTLTGLYVDFHVVGDRALISDLLPVVTDLGRAHSAGLGEVQGWEILDDPEQRSITDRGRLMRTVPAAAGLSPRPGTFTVRNATTRAPYWHRASLTECMVPIVRVAT